MGTFLSGQMLLCIQQNITHKYYNNIIFLSPSAIVTTLYPFIIVTWRNSTSAIRVMIRCLWSGPRGQWFNQTCDRINQRVLPNSSRSLYLFQAITVLLNSCYHQCEVFIFFRQINLAVFCGLLWQPLYFLFSIILIRLFLYLFHFVHLSTTNDLSGRSTNEPDAKLQAIKLMS